MNINCIPEVFSIKQIKKQHFTPSVVLREKADVQKALICRNQSVPVQCAAPCVQCQPAITKKCPPKIQSLPLPPSLPQQDLQLLAVNATSISQPRTEAMLPGIPVGCPWGNGDTAAKPHHTKEGSVPRSPCLSAQLPHVFYARKLVFVSLLTALQRSPANRPGNIRRTNKY